MSGGTRERGGVGIGACDYLYTSDEHCTLPDTRGGGQELRTPTATEGENLHAFASREICHHKPLDERQLEQGLLTAKYEQVAGSFPAGSY